MVETIGNFKPSLIKKDGFSFLCVCDFIKRCGLKKEKFGKEKGNSEF